MASCNTYKINVYIGLREGYDGAVHHTKDAMRVIREYVDEVGLGVTVTPTYFVYTGGDEPGIIIGLVNYPRFPKPETEVLAHASALANMLMTRFRQQRCTLETPATSYLMENPEFAE